MFNELFIFGEGDKIWYRNIILDNNPWEFGQTAGTQPLKRDL